MTATNNASDKWQIYLIVGIPIVVIALSTMMFFSGWGVPQSTANKGQLISPPRLLSDYGIAFQRPPSPVNKPVWTLLQIAPQGCDAACEETLVYARQMRTSLGRRTPGLARLLWVPQPEAFSATIIDEHEALTVAALPTGQQREALFADMPDRARHQFYLIDPRGFLMMYYTPDQSYKDIIHDLKFLLTQSGY